jgi:hypothetical protein
VFARLFPTKPNPITPVTLGCTSSSTQGMVQGTSAYYLVGTAVGGCSSTRLDLTAPGGGALATSLRPQLAIFRLP